LPVRLFHDYPALRSGAFILLTGEKTEKIDHLFEIGLVLVTVISASILQYLSSKYSFDMTLTNAQKLADLSFVFKELTMPIIILILLWLLKELIFGRYVLSLSLKRFVKEFCWTFLSIFLVLEILSFAFLGFISKPDQLSTIVGIMMLFAFLFTFPITWEYGGHSLKREKPKRRESFMGAMTALVEHLVVFTISYVVILAVILVSATPVA